MILSSHQLTFLLHRYQGDVCDAPNRGRERVSFFSDTDLSPFHASTNLSICPEIIPKGPSIGSFLSYQILSVMKDTPLACRRYINQQWYLFKNLPLWLDDKEVKHTPGILIENLNQLSWDAFAERCLMKKELNPLFGEDEIAHQMTTVPFDYQQTIHRNALLPNWAVKLSPEHVTLSFTAPRFYCQAYEFNKMFNSTREHLTELLSSNTAELDSHNARIF